MLICLEYTAKGTLESVIAQMCLTGVQNRYIKVAHLLRGIASGMQFFSDLGYVHKVREIMQFYASNALDELFENLELCIRNFGKLQNYQSFIIRMINYEQFKNEII